MSKINVKESILSVVKKSNLEILKIDLYNDEESFVKFDEYCKFYTTLEDLDFEVESIFMYDKVRGMIYCQDKDTKEPVWIVSCGDEDDSWWEVNRIPDFYKNNPQSYRIKPEPKYRPFANAEECWNEMQKHQPFGWVKSKDGSTINKFMFIDSLTNDKVTICASVRFTYSELVKYYIFADGMPFGVKVDE